MTHRLWGIPALPHLSRGCEANELLAWEPRVSVPPSVGLVAPRDPAGARGLTAHSAGLREKLRGPPPPRALAPSWAGGGGLQDPGHTLCGPQMGPSSRVVHLGRGTEVPASQCGWLLENVGPGKGGGLAGRHDGPKRVGT